MSTQRSASDSSKSCNGSGSGARRGTQALACRINLGRLTLLAAEPSLGRSIRRDAVVLISLLPRPH